MPKKCELMQMMCNPTIQASPPLQNPKWVQCSWRSKSRLKQLLRLIVDTYQWQAARSGNSREGVVGQTHTSTEKRNLRLTTKFPLPAIWDFGRKALGPGSTAHQNTIPVVPHPTQQHSGRNNQVGGTQIDSSVY